MNVKWISTLAAAGTDLRCNSIQNYPYRTQRVFDDHMTPSSYKKWGLIGSHRKNGALLIVIDGVI